MANDRKTQFKEKAAEELRLLLLIFAYLAAFFVAFATYRRLGGWMRISAGAPFRRSPPASAARRRES